MAHPKANETSFKPGNKLGTGGLTREARAERDLQNSLLLNATNDAVWLQAYMVAVASGVPPILLDYTYRRLGKPPETVQVNSSDALLEVLRQLPAGEQLAYIDRLAPPKETK